MAETTKSFNRLSNEFGLRPASASLPEPVEGPRAPLMSAETIGFADTFAPAVRQVGLGATVDAIVTNFDGEGVYNELRNSGLNDLDIAKQYMNIEQIDLPIRSMRSEGLTQDEILETFLDDLGLDLNKDLLRKGISPEDFLQTFVKGRNLTGGEAVAEGAGRGLTVGAPATALMVKGAALGAPFVPPFGAIVGGGLGLVGGALLGTQVEEAIFPEEPLYDPSIQALMEGTKVIGEGIVGMGAPRAFKAISEKALDSQAGYLNKLGDSIRARSFNLEKNPLFNAELNSESLRNLKRSDPVMFQFLRTYQQNPRMFQLAEGTAVVGAGLGAGAAEQFAPGSTTARIIGEAAGGMSFNIFSTVPYIFGAKDALMKDGQQMLDTAGEATSTGAVETRVGQALRVLLEERGEDPAALQALLRSPEYLDLQKRAKEEYTGVVRPLLEAQNIPAPTSRAITNSTTLALIEGRLRVLNGRFGTNIQNQMDQQNEAVNSIIETLTYTGGNNAIQTAGLLRQRRFEELLERRVANALEQSQRTVAAINPNDRTARNSASAKINEIIEATFKDVRDQEKVLYGAVPQNLSVGQENLVAKIQEQMAELTPEVAKEVYPRVAAATGARFARQMEAGQLDARIEEMGETIRRKSFGPNAETEIPPLQEELAVLQAQRADFDAEEIAPPTVQQMVNYRSFLLKEARAAASGANPGMAEARVYGQLAEAIREDLADGDSIQALNPAVNPDDLLALGTANAYSRALNDTFRRAFPNEVLQNQASGADKVIPELMYQNILRGSDDATDIRMNEINNAVNFLVDDLTPGGLAGQPEAIATAMERVGSIQGAYDVIVRKIADNTTLINPETGEVNTRAIAKFVADNESVFEQLPELKADLTNATTAQVLLKQARAAQDSGLAQSAFGSKQLIERLTGERPVRAVTFVLRSENPRQGLIDLVERTRNAARRSENDQGPSITGADGKPLRTTVDAVDAELRDAVFEAARQFSQADQAQLSSIPDFGKMETFFFNTREKVPPLVETMVKTGLLTAGERVRLKKLLTAGKGAQEVINNPAFDILEDVETTGDVLTQLLVRVSGAKAGSLVGGIMPGGRSGGLIEASAGSKAAMSLLNALPVTTINKVLEDAIKDPEYLDLLLSKELLEAPKSKLSFGKNLLGIRKLNVYFKNALGIPLGETLAEDPLTTSELLGMERFQSEGPFPAEERQAEPTPQPIAPPVAPPQASAPPPAAPNPQQRQQFAALFPNDPISSLINQQGIASLPQAPS